MSSPIEGVSRCSDADDLANQVASTLLVALAAVQSERRIPSVVLTGGSIARRIHAAVAHHPERDSVDWAWVDFWFGDERFVPSDAPERNSLQAHEDLLEHLPIDPARVHEMAASDGDHVDVSSAASAYAHDLRQAMERRGPGEPWFDLLMLGIGPDGHCASLFPGRPEVHASANVVGVRDAPKPPPMRISLGMSTLRRAGHVLFVAAGEEKAEAVAASVRGDGVNTTPAAGPRGLESTTWYVDEAAARLLP